MCGIVGVFFRNKRRDVVPLVLKLLHALQHRGQEAVGIGIYNGSELMVFKGLGLVSEVAQRIPKDVEGYIALAHTRYSTAGSKASLRNVQPIYAFHMNRWIAIAHNGNIPNHEEHRRKLEEEGSIFTTDADTEVFFHYYVKAKGDILERLKQAVSKVDRAYSMVVLDGENLIALRDAYGYRPLFVGESTEMIAIASEDSALRQLGAFKNVWEVEPGEALIVDKHGIRRYELVSRERRFCVFELIYFSRPDSKIFKHQVYLFRKETGMRLARMEDKHIDIVVPVPDSGMASAIGYAQALGKPLEMGLIRNHYTGRSFIQPTTEKRRRTVRDKLFPIREVLEGKSIALVDDSIVRGTTSKEIVRLLREHGAKEIHMRVASPPIVNPCLYGIDMPRKDELIASKLDLEGIRKFLNVDSIRYLPLSELYESVRHRDSFCFECFGS